MLPRTGQGSRLGLREGEVQTSRDNAPYARDESKAEPCLIPAERVEELACDLHGRVDRAVRGERNRLQVVRAYSPSKERTREQLGS